MKVKELIKKLEDVDPELLVGFVYDGMAGATTENEIVVMERWSNGKDRPFNDEKPFLSIFHS